MDEMRLSSPPLPFSGPPVRLAPLSEPMPSSKMLRRCRYRALEAHRRALMPSQCRHPHEYRGALRPAMTRCLLRVGMRKRMILDAGEDGGKNDFQPLATEGQTRLAC